ncbi:hypothetical protein AKJ16_DCAP17612 [Drosera capensis]
MARAINHWDRAKRGILIWAISIFLFYLSFRMALMNSSISSSTPSSSDPSLSNAERRTRLLIHRFMLMCCIWIEAEATAVKRVATTLCPMNIVLDSVVLTSTGVLLGCWQVFSGTDPIIVRADLRKALPRAPEKQLVSDRKDNIQLFHELVNRVNDRIRGFKATISELWYVEEFDLLALAMNGRMKTRHFELGCSKFLDSNKENTMKREHITMIQT